MQRNSCGTARRKALDKCLRKSYTICVVKNIWAYSSAGSASVSLLCPTELWAFKWGVCRLVAQPRHAPKYGPIAQLGERSVRIREVKGSNPSRSTIQFVLEPDSLRKRVRVRFLFTGGSAEGLLGTVNEQRQGITMIVVSCLLLCGIKFALCELDRHLYGALRAITAYVRTGSLYTSGKV